MNKTILQIEDEEGIRTLVKDILDENGYEYIGVSSVNEGLKVIESKKVDLIVLDLKLKDQKLQGIDFLKTLRNKKIKIKVIIITGSSSMVDQNIKERFRSLVVKRIAKPFGPSELIRELKKI